MAKTKFKLNRKGVREMLRSSEMGDICESCAQGIASRAGSGYEVSTYTGQNRVNAEVRTKTNAARRDNLKNNTLLKAVNG